MFISSLVIVQDSKISEHRCVRSLGLQVGGPLLFIDSPELYT